MATEEHAKKNDVLPIELPAPAGWVKKIIPKNAGTPQRSDIVFISPTGEEIKNKRQLEQYLKAHPEGPAVSEFDWATTGNTPRRSARLSEKSKAVEVSASQPPMKKQKRSSTRRGGAKEKNNADAEEDATDEKSVAVAEETDESAKVLDTDMNDVRGAPLENPSVEDINSKTETEIHPDNPSTEDAEKKTEAEIHPDNPSTEDAEKKTETIHPENPNAKDAEKKTKEINTIMEEPSAPKPPIDINSVIAPTDPATNSKIEEYGTASEVPYMINDEFKVAHLSFDPAAHSEVDALEAKDPNMDESKDAYHHEKETPDNAEPPPATTVNPDSLKEKEAAETSNNNEEGMTGS